MAKDTYESSIPTVKSAILEYVKMMEALIEEQIKVVKRNQRLIEMARDRLEKK